MDTVIMHFHRTGEPLWACGFRVGPATGLVDQVTCEACLKTIPAHPKSPPETKEPNPLVMHYHQTGSPVWACGFRVGPATGVVAQVTCKECLKTLSPQKEHTVHGHEEVVQVHAEELSEEQSGSVLFDGTGLSAMQDGSE